MTAAAVIAVVSMIVALLSLLRARHYAGVAVAAQKQAEAAEHRAKAVYGRILGATSSEAADGGETRR